MYKIVMIILGCFSAINAMEIKFGNKYYFLGKGEVYFPQGILDESNQKTPLCIPVISIQSVFEEKALLALKISEQAKQLMRDPNCFYIANIHDNKLTKFDPDIIGLTPLELLLCCTDGYKTTQCQLCETDPQKDKIIIIRTNAPGYNPSVFFMNLLEYIVSWQIGMPVLQIHSWDN